MRVLLVSTYELGHQPLHVASPAAALRKAGHEVRCLDLSVERWDAGALEWAQAAGFSVPMHTAMRLAMRAAAGVRDLARLVERGARHITFGDPDFLNGRRHSLHVVQAMHERFPDLTFDCTTKVEHILRNAELWPALAGAGCLFVISAFESVNDEILERLDKGHTTEEAARAIALLREHGIEVRPSWMPFTPWTTPGDVVEMLDFVAEHDLVGNIDPVQYTIRLLLPEGSLLLERPDMRPHLGGYDAERLSYRWTPIDPDSDRLQARLAALVEQSAAGSEPIPETFAKVRAAALQAAGRSPSPAGRADALLAGSTEGRPRLTAPAVRRPAPTE